MQPHSGGLRRLRNCRRIKELKELRLVSTLSGVGSDSVRPCVCIQIRRAADAASVQLRGLFFFPIFSPLPSCLPRGSFCIGLRMLLESFDHSCCLHGFCRVKFPTLGVFLRSRQPADPQADRLAGESAAIPSVEVCTSEVLHHFALLGGHLAQPLGPARHFLGIIFYVSVVFQSHFSGSCSSLFLQVSLWPSSGVHSRRSRLGYLQLRR